jgi:D-alanyl-D-alanine carboxypeptidase/D-alanyl-D-alanine-endopeptidase (penicillin-binding protein 4)
VIAVAAAGVLAGSGPVSRPAPAPTASIGTTILSDTPVLSVRRDPGWVDDTLAQQRLDRSLAAATAGSLAGPKSAPACVTVAQGARAVYALRPSAELLPASNLKLLTATAALRALGDGYRFTTRVAATSHPVGGTLDGNLYLVGGGDPDLMTAAFDRSLYYPEPTYTSLDRLAAAVRAAGITRITGSVIGDGSRYDNLIGVPTWSPEYLAEGDVGPLSALEVNDGVAPPSPPGAPAPTGPMDPTRTAAATFTQVLEAHGVEVAGPAATGRRPGSALAVASVESAPLANEVEQMIRVSDDTAAELLTKEMGLEASGRGTTAAGVTALVHEVAAAGLPAQQLTTLDGSGLDRADRATCTLIEAALQQAGTTGVLASGLPVAARTGTLEHRFAGTVAAGRVRAKTGTLDDVAALSGSVVPAAAPTPELAAPVYFSIIINGMDSAIGAPLADRIALVIAGYPDAVPLGELEPRS